MKKQFFGMLLSLCLVLALIPAAAFAEDGALTLTVPYTTTVKQDGSAKPGKTSFTLKLMYNNEEPFDDVKPVGLTITTDGEGDYDGMLTFTDPLENLIGLTDGVYVQQIDEGKDGWEYDERVWCVKLYLKEFGDALEVSCNVYPTEYENGVYVPLDNDRREKMTFTDIYTKSEPEETPKPEETTGPNDDTSAPDVTALPKTGDDSSLTLWLALLAVSAAAAAGAVVLRRKSARAK